MKARIIIAALLGMATVEVAAEPRFKGWTGPKPAKPPCECRYRGGKATVGQTICQQRNGKMVRLKCTLVLNNTAWKEVGEGCDYSTLIGGQSRAVLPMRL